MQQVIDLEQQFGDLAAQYDSGGRNPVLNPQSIVFQTSHENPASWVTPLN